MPRLSSVTSLRLWIDSKPTKNSLTYGWVVNLYLVISWYFFNYWTVYITALAIPNYSNIENIGLQNGILRYKCTCSLKKNLNTMASELVPKPNTKAPVWEYFGLEKDEDGARVDDGHVTCRICRRKVLARKVN